MNKKLNVLKKIAIKMVARPADYSIIIGAGLLDNIKNLFPLTAYSKIAIITDTKVAPLYLKSLLAGLPVAAKPIIIKPSDSAKNIASVIKIWDQLIAFGCDRQSLIINLGGGVVSDLGGFAASTFMRGIDFINLPTTLLSQVDASVGGKTGINYAQAKNIIGTFDQPRSVLIDTAVLETLSDREFFSGFAEIIKHGLIADKKYFQAITAKAPLAYRGQRSIAELTRLIVISCQIKAAVVRRDPREAGLRKILNFGHTAGHAIEAVSLKSGQPLLHGEAIWLGMMVESLLSSKIGLLPATDYAVVNKILAGQIANFPKAKLNIAPIIKTIASDKKSQKGIAQWTLLRRIGQAVFNRQVNQAVVKNALTEVLGKYNFI